MALLADLIGISGQYILFCIIFVCFCSHVCVHTNHNNLNRFVGHNISDFKYWYPYASLREWPIMHGG